MNEDDDLLDNEEDGGTGGVSIEAQARARGWKPLEEFNGPPSRWRTAEEFLRIGDSDNRILREEVRRLGTQNERLERQVGDLLNSAEEQREALSEMRELARRADERGYARALADLKAQRKEAVEEGNTALFDQLDEQVRELETERARPTAPTPAPTPTPTPPPAPEPAPTIAPEIVAFSEANPWFQTDQELNRVMLANFSAVQVRYPGWPLADLLEEAKQRTADEFPHKAATMGVELQETDEGDDNAPAPPPRPAPRRSGTVARPNGQGPGRRRAPSGWDTITDPAERAQAQAAFERIKKSDPDYTVAEYLAVYNDPHADAIELRRQRSAQG